MKKQIQNREFRKIYCEIAPAPLLYIGGGGACGWAWPSSHIFPPLLALYASSSSSSRNWGWSTQRSGTMAAPRPRGVRWMSTSWSFQLNGYCDCLDSHGRLPCVSWWLLLTTLRLNVVSAGIQRQVVSSSCWTVLGVVSLESAVSVSCEQLCSICYCLAL